MSLPPSLCVLQHIAYSFSAPFSHSSLPGALLALVSLMCPVSLELFSHVFSFFFFLLLWLGELLYEFFRPFCCFMLNMRVNPSSIGLVQCGFYFLQCIFGLYSDWATSSLKNFFFPFYCWALSELLFWFQNFHFVHFFFKTLFWLGFLFLICFFQMCFGLGMFNAASLNLSQSINVCHHSFSLLSFEN